MKSEGTPSNQEKDPIDLFGTSAQEYALGLCSASESKTALKMELMTVKHV